MIRFALRCAAGHGFDSWFRDNASYDQLRAGSLIACPVCGSTAVEKALMTPAVVTSRRRSDPPAALPPSPRPVEAPPSPAVPADDKALMLRSMLREMRDHLVRNSKDVGPAFAAEARRIHEGDAEEAAIHGVASPGEVEALLDDGIDIMPLPVFPDERN